MNKTAVMFAGIDSLDTEELRLSAFKIPEVQIRLQQAHLHLLDVTSGGLSLLDHAHSAEAEFQSQLSLKSFVCAAIQIGLYDRYLKSNPEPDYLVGCSLGDAARTVCSGAMNFEEILYGTYLFGIEGNKTTNGSVVGAKSLIQPLTETEVQEIRDFGLDIAVYQTPIHFLVVGDDDLIDKWMKLPETQQRYFVRLLCNSPLHSKAMTSAKDVTLDHFKKFEIKPWKIPMVSSVYGNIIGTREDLLADMSGNMASAVCWWPTYKYMAEKLHVNRFVNIGPAKTLIKFCERTPVHPQVELVDSLDLDGRQLEIAL